MGIVFDMDNATHTAPNAAALVHALGTDGLTVCGIKIPRDRRTKEYRALRVVCLDALPRVTCPGCK